jgi:hypothetical protein
MNRRNVLTGLGGLAISGGALFGTGAFTSVSATRGVEVNVLGGSNGTVDGTTSDDDQKAIADSITEGAVDVLVDLSSDSIGVKDSTGTVTNDGSALYPSPDNISTVYTDSSGNNAPFTNATTESQYVSLVANDVTIVFGSDNANQGLPQDSDVTFGELFAFADPYGNAPDVNFKTSAESADPLLTAVGSDGTDLTGGPGDEATVELSTKSSSNGAKAKATVDTGTTDGATERLDIGIGESPPTNN